MKKFKDYSELKSIQELNVPRLWKKYKESGKNYAAALPFYRKKVNANEKKGIKTTPSHIAAEIAKTFDLDTRSFIRYIDMQVNLGKLDDKYQPGKINKIGRFKPGNVAHIRAEETNITETVVTEISRKKVMNYIDKAGKDWRKKVIDRDDEKADKRMKGIDRAVNKVYPKPRALGKDKNAGKVMGKKMYEENLDELFLIHNNVIVASGTKAELQAKKKKLGKGEFRFGNSPHLKVGDKWMSEEVLVEGPYEDRVKKVADAVMKSNPGGVPVKDKIREIEKTARAMKTIEMRSSKKAKNDFIRDVTRLVKTSRVVAPKKNKDRELRELSMIIDSAIGNAFPDGDPFDEIAREARKLGYKTNDGSLIDVLDVVTKKYLGGKKGYHDYVAAVWDEFMADTGQNGRNPWK